METWVWIVCAIAVLFILIIISFLSKTASMIRKLTLGRRFDDDNTLHYFTHEDFENMSQEKFEFTSNNIILQGYIYKVGSPSKGPLVFVHGMGAGHIQYTTEIHYYASLGYEVYTFDCQGCLLSQGEGMDYFTNGARNLDDFLNFIEAREEFKDQKYQLVGHSMGAYAAGIMVKYHASKIDKTICISPFENVNILIRDQLVVTLKTMGKIMAKVISIQEKRKNSKYSLNLSKVLNETDNEVLIVMGSEDNVISTSHNYEHMKAVNINKDNIHFALCNEKLHRPNITQEAVQYDVERTQRLDALLTEHNNKLPEDVQREYYDSLDYNLLVALDSEVMSYMDKFLFGEDLPKEIIFE